MSTITSVSTEIAAGDAITLIELASEHRTAPSTIFRWKAVGLPNGPGSRVFLECVRRGKKWITSRAAVMRFFAALPHSPPTATPVLTPPSGKRHPACVEKRSKTKTAVN